MNADYIRGLKAARDIAAGIRERSNSRDKLDQGQRRACTRIIACLMTMIDEEREQPDDLLDFDREAVLSDNAILKDIEWVPAESDTLTYERGTPLPESDEEKNAK